MKKSSTSIDLDRRTLLLLGLTGAPALALRVDGVALADDATENPVAMLVAAQAFLNSLGPKLRTQVTLPLEGDDRFRWHYFPQEMFARKGVRLKDMNEAQRKAALVLLRSALSAQGYLKATQIMQLEKILGALEGGGIDRDPELYSMMLFGTPSRDQPWGWRAEGHHLSLTFIAVKPDLIASTPAFMGSNPAEVPAGPHAGLRILKAEQDVARSLLASLDEGQRSRAVILTDAPRDIVSGNSRTITLSAPEGLASSAMTEGQRDMLRQLIGEYVQNMHPAIAQRQWERIERAGIEVIHFAWAGSAERGQPHYYRVHGPTVLIEYDNTQNGANHIHSVWRDPQDDFGVDLLRQHYATSEHHRSG
jgi:hypothetical protein